MDRAGAVTLSEGAWMSHRPGDDFVLPSRGAAIAGLATALGARRGPLLLTGEPGVGKTWVCRRLRESMPSAWHWAAIDLVPALSEAELLQLILHALHCDPVHTTADARTLIIDTLNDAAEDGKTWGLLVDEAHNASLSVLEELRILGNRMGDRGAFAGLVLVGQTTLARRLTTRALAPLQARISARVHLRSIDVEELGLWLTQLDPGRNWDGPLVERLHQETAGNPRRVLARPLRRGVEGISRAPSVSPRVSVTGAMAPTRNEPLATEPRIDRVAAPVAPGKPPLQIGEGMIEVGWEPSEGPEPEADLDPLTETDRLNAPRAVVAASATGPPATDESEEVVDDHYAALQAWTEWARNQGRRPVEAAEHLVGEVTDALDPEENPAARMPGHSGVRVEGQQEFAPYSQLFSRLRQARGSS